MTNRTEPSRARSRASLGALVCFGLGALALSGKAQESGDDFRPYILLLSEQATEQATAIEKALQSSELDRAVELVQKLIEEGDGQLVRRPALEPDSKDTPDHRSFEVYAGARAHARGVLLEGPRALRRAYDKRFGAEARSRFERARDAGDEAAVEDLLRRFSATSIGASAARWMADRALERGDLARFEHYLHLADRAGADGEEHVASGSARRWIAHLLRGDEGDPRTGRDPGAAPAPDHVDLGGRTVPLSELEARAREARDASLALRAQEYPSVELASSNRVLPPLVKPVKQWDFRLPEDAPYHSERRNGTCANIHPVVHQGTVLFTDSMRAYALDLYVGPDPSDEPAADPDRADYDREPRNREFRTGRPLWVSEWSEGMTEEEAAERDGRNAETILAGTAADGIFVVPLQVRISQPRQTFRDFEITPPIPTHRLFAFEAATGRRLWSHWRAELAGSEISDRNEFLERAYVAGPPVAEGHRVLVPMYISEARFKYFVACFDLRTGATLWVRYLLTGQKEMNMFGHIVEGFAAPPVLVRDGLVYAVTNLGAVAALDLVDGDVRWMSSYHTLPLPRPAIQPSEREKIWLNQPPALTGGVLFCTPVDGNYLCAFDAASGAPYVSGPGWMYVPPPHMSRLCSLLYVDSNRAIVARTDGVEVIAHPQAERRFTRRGAREFALLDRDSYLTKPRAAATSTQLFFSDRTELYEIDLEKGGEPVSSQSVGLAFLGNCLIADGVLLVASNDAISAFFDKETVERSVLARARSGGPLDRMRYAQYLERDALRRYGERDEHAGDAALERAARTLEPDHENAQARAFLARLALVHAEHAERRGDVDAAVSDLERALALVADGEMRWRALVAQERVLREKRGYPPSYADCLARLESEFEGRPFPMPDGSSVRTGAYVAWRRYAQARAARDVGAQIAALNQILVDHPDEIWEGDKSGERARITVAELLEIFGRDAYAPFEREAERLTAAAAGKPAELERIAAIYPNSLAAERIRLELLDDAGHLDRSTRAARAALENGAALPAIWRRVAATAERAGSTARSQALLRRLASTYGEEVSTLPADAGQRFAELAPANARTAPPVPPADEAKLERWDAPWADGTSVVLSTQGEDLATRDLILLQRGGLLALYEVSPANREPLRLRWQYAPPSSELQRSQDPWHRRVAVSGDRLVFAAYDRFIWIDLASGLVRQETALPPSWKIGVPGQGSGAGFSLEDGVLVAIATQIERAAATQKLVAFDAETGALLWERPAPVLTVSPPLVGDGFIAVLGPLGATDDGPSTRVPLAILDLYTGWLRHLVSIPGEMSPSRRPGLILAGRLVLRHLRREPGVMAIDLTSGKIAWSDTQEPLDDGTLSANTRWYLIAAAQRLYAAVPYFDVRLQASRWTFVSIDLETGARRDVAVLSPNDVTQGLDGVVELERTEIVVWVHDGSNVQSTPRFTLLDLATGSMRFSPRNAAGLPQAKLHRDLAQRGPLPCIDDRSVLLHFTTGPNPRQEMFVRRFSARHGEPSSPPWPLPRDEITSLIAVAGCYVVTGPDYLTVLRPAESTR